MEMHSQAQTQCNHNPRPVEGDMTLNSESAEILAANANTVFSNPLLASEALSQVPQPPSGCSTIFYTRQSIPEDLLRWCFNLVKTNLYDQYVAAKDTGWSDNSKWKEMSEENTLYLLVRGAEADVATGSVQIGRASDALGQQNTEDLLGFMSFQFTTEESGGAAEEGGSAEEIAVVYCYELQLIATARNRGIGAYLMKILEKLGQRYGMRKSMLTVFKSNEGAIRFYRNLGYDLDHISPGKAMDPRRARRISYEIFSKSLRFE
ncbi:hypothetical protein BC832DRAFT_548277 [Gaertneriomyces semiglobifer]|nr:hypothetical protein BC832DRAFT_548277 [Gaertneriomyces semiglobifer]